MIMKNKNKKAKSLFGIRKIIVFILMRANIKILKYKILRNLSLC